MKMKNVLTIAGSDSSGGAGIQADLKTFAALGVYGMSVLTALTAQNTHGVHGVFNIPADFVQQQIDAVTEDIGTDAWKTGMLATSDVIHVVAERAQHYGVKRLVVDPVMVARSGDLLLHPCARDAMIHALIPRAYVLTPNHYEAEAMTGMTIRTVPQMQAAAVSLHEMGARYVVVKGGDVPNNSEAIDVLYDGNTHTVLRAPRIDTRNNHGTGCTFASAIAAELAKGHTVEAAVRTAKEYINAAMLAAEKLDVGNGYGPLNHSLGQTMIRS